MTVGLAQALTACLGLYALVGAVFGLFFVSFGAARLDPEAKAMPLQARALVFWGAAGLWPLLIPLLIRGRP